MNSWVYLHKKVSQKREGKREKDKTRLQGSGWFVDVRGVYFVGLTRERHGQWQ